MEEILLTFLVSVGASVVGYYICKWLDSISIIGIAHRNEQEPLRAATLRGSFTAWKLLTFLSCIHHTFFCLKSQCIAC